MHLFPIPSALFNPLRIPSRILHKGFCTAFMFARCLQLKQVSQQSAALWGPGRDSLFPVFSAALSSWALCVLAQTGRAPACTSVSRSSTRIGRGGVETRTWICNTGRHFCAFPLPQFNIEICCY